MSNTRRISCAWSGRALGAQQHFWKSNAHGVFMELPAWSSSRSIHPRQQALAFAVTLFRVALNSTKTKRGFLTTTRSQPRLGSVGGSRGPTQIHISGASATGPVSRRATSAPSHRADEPPGPQAPGKQAALTTPIARIVPGAVRECDVPVPTCSAFRLLSSLSYSHAWPFAVAKATQVCTRNRTSPIAVEEPPSSRDPTTRPLRRSPRPP